MKMKASFKVRSIRAEYLIKKRKKFILNDVLNMKFNYISTMMVEETDLLKQLFKV
jgi:hypothetical protein